MLKIYLRMNPVGAACTASAWAIVRFSRFDPIPEARCCAVPVVILLAGSLLQPVLKIGLLHDQKPGPHFIVLHAAKLGTGYFILADLLGREMDPDRHAGHRILLHPHDRYEKAVGDVLG